jgi:2-methylisocitrate lyase-like PEP mutase family enzyme
MKQPREPSPVDPEHVTIGVGVHNALTALIAQNAGFRLLWLGSLEMSASLGLPDLNLVTPTEVAAIIRAVRSVTDLPLYVDADEGYGSDTTALRALAEFEAVGASAMCIEDNQFPKRNSLCGTSHVRVLEPADRFARRIGKLAAAAERVRIIARTESLVADHGPDDAIERLCRYADAGADALFVQVNSQTADQLLPVLDKVAGLRPLVLAPTALPHLRPEDLAPYGDVTMLFANVVVRGIAAFTQRLLRTLGEQRTLSAVSSELQALPDLFALTGMDEWAAR